MTKRASSLGPSIAQPLNWSWFLSDLLRAMAEEGDCLRPFLYTWPLHKPLERSEMILSMWGRLLWHRPNKSGINSLIIRVGAFVLKRCISIIYSAMPLSSPSVHLMLRSHISLSGFRRRKRQQKRDRQSKSSAIALWMTETLADTLHVPSVLSSISITPAIKANGCWDNSSTSWLPTQILSFCPCLARNISTLWRADSSFPSEVG